MKHKSSLIKKRGRYGYFFIFPFLIGLVFYFIVPLIGAFRFSLSELKVNSTGYELSFVGSDNFKHAFLVDTEFRKLLLSSVGNMCVNVPITVIFSFFLASLVSMEFKGRGVVRTILFLPIIISSGAVAMLTADDYMSIMISNSDKYTSASGGLASVFVSTISQLELSSGFVDFLVQSVERVYDITVMSAVPIVIFLAALQSISNALFEAAYIEGATKWEVFWKIKFPMVSPHILVCLIYSIVDSFNNASNVVIANIKNVTYTKFNYGMGAAMSFSYMAIVLVILGIVYWAVSRKVFYND